MPEEDRLRGELHERFLLEFTKVRHSLYAYIFSLLPNRDDAEDIFQRVSIILWEKFDQFDAEGSFFSWACGVAFYEIKNFLRVTSRKRLQFRDDLMKQLADERAELLKRQDVRLPALQECLQRLAKKDRVLIRQAYNSSESIKDIALESGRAVQSVYNRLNLLRGQLAECIQRKIAMAGDPS